jgi:hypothetical protein
MGSMGIVAGRTPPDKHCVNSCANWTPRQGAAGRHCEKKVSAGFAFESTTKWLVNAESGHAGKAIGQAVAGQAVEPQIVRPSRFLQFCTCGS